MKKLLSVYAVFLFLFIYLSNVAVAQSNDNAGYKKMAAGPEYKRSSLYQALWGKNYRKEWTTPVTFPVTHLDTLRGGMQIYKIGGGNQSKSLRLKSKEGKEYALRSVNKSLKILVPKIFHNTFIEHIANDGISMSHPYGALGVPAMAQAAGIPHSRPQYLWFPEQPGFDTLNAKYANRLYLFEQRADRDWSNADNFLNFKKFDNSEELLEKLFDDNDNSADQTAFVKARLFDMLIGDWDRHWDQWKWGKIEKDGKNVFVPIPTDRDQAFSTTGGALLKIVLAAGGLKYIQPFGYKIEDVTATERRFLDRLLTNQLTLDQWLSEAKALQQSLTDNTIEASIKQMPPEIFAISGNELIAKLKARRNDLQEYAAQYYHFLAKEVEVVGSKSSEYFDVNRLNDNETQVNIFNITKEGKKAEQAFYSRTFKNNETEELRLYGLSGKDVYTIYGNANSGIRLRIIGGDQEDSITNTSNVKVHIYDDAKNTFAGSNRLHLSNNTDHTFNYDTYIPDKKGISPLIGFTNADRLFVGLGYTIVNHKWRKLPYASKNSVGVRYSISQKAISAFYKGIFPNFIGKWNLLLNADYDAIRWLNFYGIGNKTVSPVIDIPYNRTQLKQIDGNVDMERKAGKNTFTLSAFYQSVQLIKDADRFVAKIIAPVTPDIFKTNNYTGVSVNYKFAVLNDSIVPTSGFYFTANAAHFQNLTLKKSFQRYTGVAQVFVPLFSKFSLAIRAAGGTVNGNPMFYHLPHLGGADDLRGYRRERFWGKTTFSNSNELRFITPFRSYIMNGKIGLSVFYDQGRVWQPGETSNTWHTNYGAGFLLAPFNMVLANIAYGVSKERSMMQLRIIKSF